MMKGTLFILFACLLTFTFSSIIPVTPTVNVELDSTETKFRVQRNGKFTGFFPVKTKVLLVNLEFDPLELKQTEVETIQKEFPYVPSSLSQNQNEDVFLVQFKTSVLPEYKAILANLGAVSYFSIPKQSLLIRVNKDVVEQIRALPFVRWIGTYYPLYKAEKDILQAFKLRTQTRSRYSIMLLERGIKMQEEVASFIESQGGKVELFVKKGFRIEAILTQNQLISVLRLSQVLYIDFWREKGEDMSVVRLYGGLDYVARTEGFLGDGVRAEVMDSGLRVTHTDFQNLELIIHGGNSASTSHGTSVFGIVFGNGKTNAGALGGMPRAEAAIFAAYTILDIGNYTRYEHTEQLVDPTGIYKSVFQTNSWGDAQTTSYTTISAEMDDIIFLNDITILQSQSNMGNRNSRPQAWAKNIISIGGFYHYDTLTRSDDRWNGGASIGPATDGRQKPDLAHFYDQVLATSSSSDTAYSQFSGTSAATPCTAGHVGIFYQMWAQGIFHGGNPLGADVFDVRAHSSTAKAILINTANQFDFDASSTQQIRVHQGWGTVDVGRAYDVAKIHSWKLPLLVDETDPISAFETITYNIQVATSNIPTSLKVTLVYRDPMPATSASKQLVNDLDLQLISPSGKIYWGNNGLSTGTCSTSGGAANDIDNVENIFICESDIENGTWEVNVIASEIVEDGNLETETLDAVFSLVASKGRV